MCMEFFFVKYCNFFFLQTLDVSSHYPVEIDLQSKCMSNVNTLTLPTLCNNMWSNFLLL